VSGALVVNEIFTSIQGETTGAGRPCTFVRLTGCNLRCGYCDTAYAFHEGEERTLDAIVAEVEGRGVTFVTITGGEPLLQPGARDLIRRLLDRGFEVQVETGGSLETDEVDPRARLILDVKTPGSGMAGKMNWDNLARIRRVDEVKFVLVDRADYEFARQIILGGRVPAGAPILLSPAHGDLDPKDLARWILEDRLPARLQIQMHKYVWGSDARGV
jgi:7-carboxy-7-deazaguanine synthase